MKTLSVIKVVGLVFSLLGIGEFLRLIFFLKVHRFCNLMEKNVMLNCFILETANGMSVNTDILNVTQQSIPEDVKQIASKVCFCYDSSTQKLKNFL